MSVYIANFGRGNYDWPTCRAQNAVSTMMHEGSYPFYRAGDRQGFIAWCVANRKTARGITPTPAVASRWYGAMATVENTADDLWLHKDEDRIWWTRSLSGEPEWNLEPSGDPDLAGQKVYVCRKPSLPWSDKDLKGRVLLWYALHPKATPFLFTEGTLQKLSDDNAAYAMALIEGDNLQSWHSQPEWQAKAANRKHGQVKVFNARERSIRTMVETVKQTVAGANGQQVLRTVKNKELRFPNEEDFARYLDELLEQQGGMCAISGIPLQHFGEEDDRECLCSLDRIDSDGHYEAGNLQIVCRFINRWKSDGNNDEFSRLIALVRHQSEQ